MKKTRKGFTIVELIIVIAVIAVLTAILVPTFIHLTKRANEAADHSLVTNLNKALAMREAEEGEKGKNNTMYDCVMDLDKEGYKLPQLATRSGEDLVWSQQANRFFLSSEYERDKVEKNYGEKYNCWHVYEKMPETQEWAIYPNEDKWTEASITVSKVGFDAGKAKISQVTYNGEVSKTVTIRTNGSGTSLSINGYVDPSDNKKGDVIKHYGTVGGLSIIKCAVGSYHENGNVAFAEINTGRIVLEESSKVKHIHINANKDANGFEEVVIADNGTKYLPNAITRDEVTVTQETTVVTIVSSAGTETIKVYKDGEKGTTEKTETQNAGVNSPLGQLALDNGYDSKVLDEQEKEAAKEESINEAMVEEYSSSDSKDIPENAVAYNVNTQKYYSKGEEYASDMVALRAAIDSAENKDIILLLKDITLNQASGGRIPVSKSVTINGNNHTVTTNARGFGVGVGATSNISVTFKDITITNNSDDGRCIDTRGNLSSLTLDNVTLRATGSGYAQPLTIGGYQEDVVPIKIKNSTIETKPDGSNGYAIITFNPVEMTIIHSTLKGWACLYLKGVDGSAGSSGSTVNISDVHFVSKNNKSIAESNRFSAIKIEAPDIEVNCNLLACTLDIVGETNEQGIVSFQDTSFQPVPGCSLTLGKGTVVNFEGSTFFANSTQAGSVLTIVGGSYNEDPSEFVPEGYNVVEEDGVWTVYKL